MVQCRTRERNDGTTYKICYDEKKRVKKQVLQNLLLI